MKTENSQHTVSLRGSVTQPNIPVYEGTITAKFALNGVKVVDGGSTTWNYGDSLGFEPDRPVLASAKPIIDWIICLLMAVPPDQGGSAIHALTGGTYKSEYAAANQNLGFSLRGSAQTANRATTGTFKVEFSSAVPAVGDSFTALAQLVPNGQGSARATGVIVAPKPGGSNLIANVDVLYSFDSGLVLPGASAIVRTARRPEAAKRKGWYREEAF